MAFGDVFLKTFEANDARRLATNVNVWLATQQRLLIRDANVSQQLDKGTSVLRLLVMEANNDVESGYTYNCLGLQGNTEPDVQLALSNWNASYPYALVAFMIPIPGAFRRPAGGSLSYLFIFIEGVETDYYCCGPKDIFVGSPTTAVAPQASGTFNMWTVDGTSISQKTVKNASLSSPWNAGDRNFVIYDLTSGLLVGIPSYQTDDTSPITVATTHPVCVR